MPTHQGKTQTDILIGDGGESAQEHSEFEFFATYATTATLEYVDLAPGTDRQYGGYELLVRNAVGTVIATFAARYKAWVDRGSAGGPKSIDISNNFNPGPDGDTPGWPLSPTTIAKRLWRVDTFDKKSNLYAQLWVNWQLRTTIAVSGGSVIQTVTDQTDDLLRVHYVFMDGQVVLLDVVATMPSTASVTGSVTADPPDVVDTFTP
ncbi:MAG TPA: hypothetical protein VK034_32380 [Enhygromyxa sp.]|nr:hypothetical protein [Enhygromyxa sp.]